MARIDWQGLATAIGQVNQLLEPSYAQKKELEFQDWKKKEIWSTAFEQLAEAHDDYAIQHDKHIKTLDKGASIDVTLNKGLKEFDSGNAINVNRIMTEGTLESIFKRTQKILQKTENMVDVTRKAQANITSVDMGKNTFDVIPLQVNLNMEDHLRGIPVTDPTTGKQVIDPDTNMPKYTPFDANQDNTLSEEEHTAAVLSITTMLANNPEYADSFNPEAFSLGYQSKVDEEKIEADKVKAEDEKKRLDTHMKRFGWSEEEYKAKKNNTGVKEIKNMSMDEIKDEVRTLEAMIIEDSIQTGTDQRRFYHDEHGKKHANASQISETKALQDRLKNLKAHGMKIDSSYQVGLPTLAAIATKSNIGKYTPFEEGTFWDDEEAFKYGDGDDDFISPEDYKNIMSPDKINDVKYDIRRNAIIHIVENPVLPDDIVEKLLRVVDIYDKFPEEKKINYMNTLNSLISYSGDDTSFNNIYNSIMKKIPKK